MNEDGKIIRVNFGEKMQKIVDSSKELVETTELAGAVFYIKYCAHCNRPIKKGQLYRKVQCPNGMLNVHQICLGG